MCIRDRLALGAYAQDDVNPIQTAMPSLNIAPDARAGGMGDAGVATAPDGYSQHSVSYTHLDVYKRQDIARCMNEFIVANIKCDMTYPFFLIFLSFFSEKHQISGL